MGVGKPSELFVRRTSGLVREMSVSSAVFYNMAAAIGSTLGCGWVYFLSLPVSEIQIGPWAIQGFEIGVGVGGAFMLLLAYVYMCLVSVMPRTGGDYVFTTRITSPFVGWLEGWCLLWTVLGFVATTMYLCNWQLNATLAIGGYFMGWSSLIPASQWWLSNTAIVVMAVIVGVLIFLQALLPAKAYFNAFKWIVLTCTVLGCFSIPLFLGVTPDKALVALQNFNSMTSSPASAAQLNSTVTSMGFVNPVPFSLQTVFFMAGFSMFLYIGFQFSIYFAGELKGNVTRNVMISTLAPLLGILLLDVFVALPIELNAMGLVGPYINWGWLWWANEAAVPSGSYPAVQLLAAVVNPSWAWLALIASIGVFGLTITILSSWAALVSRIVFAWSLDRVIPSWFATVNSRTRTPIRLLLLAAIAVVVLTVLAVLGANPIISAWFTVLMSILTWVMPGINAMLLPYRRKDLFELAPSWARKKVGGMWVLVIAGTVFLLFILVSYFYVFIAPFIQAVSSAGLAGFAGYAIETGIAAFFATLILGTIVWFVSKWYNAKRGISFRDIFTQLPPQ